MTATIPHNHFYTRRVAWLIALSTLIRLIVAGSVELGNDEVYYWTYSQHLQWNYFDHPPMVAIWIRLFTGNLTGQNSEVFLRLGSILSCAAATWLLFRTATLLHSERAGWFTACLYTGSIYASIIAGIFILPDSPQMLFWALSLFALARLSIKEKSWNNWFLFGLCAGLCIMSKVHGVFLWSGVFFYVIFSRRSWLLLPQLYVAALTTAIIICPILIWNIDNHFVTYTYHSQRVRIEHFSLNTDGFLREWIGQILYNNPANVVLIIQAILSWRKKSIERTPTLAVFNWIALPMAVTLLIISLFRDTLPHWSGPAYVTLLPLAGIFLASRQPLPFIPAILKWSLGLLAFILPAGVLLINFYPGSFGAKGVEQGTGDFTLDMQGWRKAGVQFDSIYQQQVKLGNIPAAAPLVSYKWFPAAHEDYYFAHPVGTTLIGLGTMEELHHYLWLNQIRYPWADFTRAICIVPSNEFFHAGTQFNEFYTHVDSLTTINSYRNGRLARRFYVYRLSGFRDTVPTAKNFWKRH